MVRILEESSSKSTWNNTTALGVLTKLTPVTSSAQAMSTLGKRGINGMGIPTTALGIAPPASVLRKIGLPRWQAKIAAGLMLTPLFDQHGEVQAFRARSPDGKPIRLKGGRKTKSVAIGPSSGAVMLTASGLAMIRGESTPQRVVIGEGEGDFWIWEKFTEGIAYLGTVSGSACEEMAAKIPDNTVVVLRHHLDEGGDRMANKWAYLLESRCELWRLRGKKGGPDDGDRWMEGTFHIHDPLKACRPYDPPPLVNPEDERSLQLERIIRGESKYPSAHYEVRMLSRYQGFVDSVLSTMSSHPKGGRALAIYRGTHTIAGACAALEEILPSCEAALFSSESRSLTESTAIHMMGSHGRKEALSQVKSAWRSGEKRSLKLEDNNFEYDEINYHIQKRKRISAQRTKIPVCNQFEELVTERKSLTEIRAELETLVTKILDQNKVSILVSPCGSGKTRLLKKQIIHRLKEQRGQQKVVVSLPTKDLVQEMKESFQREADEEGALLSIREAITRSPKTCAHFAVVKHANSNSPSGGSEYCRNICPFGWKKWRGEEETPCSWVRANKSNDHTDILINTHALETRRTPLTEDEDAALRIDWPSFEHLTEQGVPSSPIVVRSNSFTIRAIPDEEGTPIPKAEMVYKSGVSAASKRDILEWLIDTFEVKYSKNSKPNDQHLRGLLDQHVREISGLGDDARITVRWRSIAEISYRGELFPLAVPSLKINTEGESPQVQISIKLQDGASPLPEIDVRHRKVRSDQSKGEVLNWIAEKWGIDSTKEALREAAIERVELYPVDITVFDESIWGQVLQNGQASVEQIGHCIASGEISGIGGGALLRLMGQCLEQKRDIFAPEILDQISTQDLFIDPGHTGRIALAGLKSEQSIDAHVQALQNIIPWITSEGIHRALQRNWRGLYISKRGNLCVSWIRPIDTRHSRSTVCLDATATPEISKACFAGQNIEITELKQKRPEDMKVIWIPLETGTSAGCFSGNSRTALARILAIQMEYGGEETLVVSHKKHVEEGKYVFQRIADDGSSLIHHNGTLARGSNQFETLSTAVLHDYHAPKGVIRVQAEALAIALGEDISDPIIRKKLEGEVQFQLEIAPVRQAAQRTRANLATSTDPKTLVFVGSRSPERLGYEVDVVVDPDQLVRKHLGRSPTSTRKSVAHDLLDHIGSRGYAPTIAMNNPGDILLGDLIPGEVKNSLESLLKTFGDNLLTDIEANLQRSVSLALTYWNQKCHNSDWGQFAKYLGVSLVMIETSGGGKSTPYLFRGDLDRMDISRWMTSRGVRWWRVKGESEVTNMEDASGVMAIIGELIEEDLCTLSIGDLLAWVAGGLGLKSGRSARTRLDRYRLENEGMRECFVRLWQAARAQRNTAAVEHRIREDGVEVEEALLLERGSACEVPMPWDIDRVVAALDEVENLLEVGQSFEVAWDCPPGDEF